MLGPPLTKKQARILLKHIGEDMIFGFTWSNQTHAAINVLQERKFSPEGWRVTVPYDGTIYFDLRDLFRKYGIYSPDDLADLPEE